MIIDRYMLCRKHQVLNNVLTGCPKRVLLSKAEDNQCNGNLYDDRDDYNSLCVQFPAPKARLNLESWQRNFGYDLQGGQVRVTAAFNPKEMTLELEIQGEIPPAVYVSCLHKQGTTPGPWPLKPGHQVFQIQAGKPNR